LKIILTGASGFLGSALARHWCNSGHEVSLLLRESSKLDRLNDVHRLCNVIRYTTDFEIEAFFEMVQPEAVVHTACSYGRAGETDLQLFDSNLRLGIVLLQALRRVSNPVYFVNTCSALAPEISAYALSKNQFSQWGRMLAKQSNGRLVFLNVLLQHMYGSGDDLSKFTTHVLHACHRNDPELKLTSGEQKRDFIYIDDVVSAYDAILANFNQLDFGKDIEIGYGSAPTIRQFVETVHWLTKSHTKLLFGALPYRANEAMHCLANIESMKQLGWKPAFDLNAGITKMIELEFDK
jgi:CDP-paratose synthetase